MKIKGQSRGKSLTYNVKWADPVSTDYLTYVILLDMIYRLFDSKIDYKTLYHTPAPNITKAYILGALHDSTERKYTFRISQKSLKYVELLADGIHCLDYNAWIYREGKNRNVFVVEFSKKVVLNKAISTIDDKIDYIRGYFDTEGSVPRSLEARYYIYFAQKDYEDLHQLRNYIMDLEISCGKIHNPSKRVDPDYFRFYVLSRSFRDFGRVIGSWHPEKGKFVRMKI